MASVTRVTTMHDLKEKTVRGAIARLGAQGANFVVRLGSLMVLTRLLGPKEFGLIGMTTAFTGVLSLFRDFGLSSAAIQRTAVSEAQLSALFWINVFVGAALTIVTAAMSPLIAAFYREPALVGVTIVIATGFLFNAAGVQHSALLQRQMRFTSLSVVNVIALVVSSVVGVVGAFAGYGYWALSAMTVALPLVSTIGFWVAARWIPMRPRRGAGIGSMLRFGGAMTLNSVAVYVGMNIDKVFLGRVWGADVLGVYGRAYQLINIPTDNLNATAGEVAFAALSRLQHDPIRLRSYFLKGYAVVIALTVPITVACSLFADDVVAVLLGPRWTQAVMVFRLLAPTMLVLAVVNPLGWLLSSLGRVDRLIKIAVTFVPLMVAGCLAGLRYGALGVAIGYSTVMVVWAIPVIAWAVQGTGISFRDIAGTAAPPFIASLAAAAFGLASRYAYGSFGSNTFARLTIETSVLAGVYLAALLYGDGRNRFYVDLLRGLVVRPSGKPDLVSI